MRNKRTDQNCNNSTDQTRFNADTCQLADRLHPSLSPVLGTQHNKSLSDSKSDLLNHEKNLIYSCRS